MMSVQALVYCFTAGAAALALWVDVRFGSLAPAGASRRVVHAALALATADFLAPAAIRGWLAVSPTAPSEVVALFALLLPALVYVFLSGLWLLRLLQGALASRYR